jgi:hypothetical protein
MSSPPVNIFEVCCQNLSGNYLVANVGTLFKIQTIQRCYSDVKVTQTSQKEFNAINTMAKWAEKLIKITGVASNPESLFPVPCSRSTAVRMFCSI